MLVGGGQVHEEKREGGKDVDQRRIEGTESRISGAEIVVAGREVAEFVDGDGFLAKASDGQDEVGKGQHAQEGPGSVAWGGGGRGRGVRSVWCVGTEGVGHSWRMTLR